MVGIHSLGGIHNNSMHIYAFHFFFRPNTTLCIPSSDAPVVFIQFLKTLVIYKCITTYFTFMPSAQLYFLHKTSCPPIGPALCEYGANRRRKASNAHSISHFLKSGEEVFATGVPAILSSSYFTARTARVIFIPLLAVAQIFLFFCFMHHPRTLLYSEVAHSV